MAIFLLKLFIHWKMFVNFQLYCAPKISVPKFLFRVYRCWTKTSGLKQLDLLMTTRLSEYTKIMLWDVSFSYYLKTHFIIQLTSLELCISNIVWGIRSSLISRTNPYFRNKAYRHINFAQLYYDKELFSNIIRDWGLQQRFLWSVKRNGNEVFANPTLITLCLSYHFLSCVSSQFARWFTAFSRIIIAMCTIKLFLRSHNEHCSCSPKWLCSLFRMSFSLRKIATRTCFGYFRPFDAVSTQKYEIGKFLFLLPIWRYNVPDISSDEFDCSWT